MPYNLRTRKVPAQSAPPPPKKKLKQEKQKSKKEQPELNQEQELNQEHHELNQKKEPKREVQEVKLDKKDPKLDEQDLKQKPESKVEVNQYVFGQDTCGELGLKKIGFIKKKPTTVSIDDSIKSTACGPMHTLSLTSKGVVYSFGCNDEGALGRTTDGDEIREATPHRIELDGTVIKISTGDSHGAALLDNGHVYIWGNFRDEHGSVGLLPECNGQATYHPIPVLPHVEFKDIASGSNHMLLLDIDGNVYSFGVGAQGQLGRLGEEEAGTKEKTVAINAENRDLFLTPKIVSMKNVDPQREFVCDAIYAGNFSSFATNTDKKKNRLAAWGLNNYYQLGYKGQKGQLVQYYPRRSTFTCSTSMINVACGQHHTLFLTKTGRVYTAGRNEYGMLGVGESMREKKELCPAKPVDGFTRPIVDIGAGINTSFAVSDEGKLFSWGMNGPNLGIDSSDEDLMVPTEVNSLAAHKVISVSAGGSFTSVIVE